MMSISIFYTPFTKLVSNLAEKRMTIKLIPIDVNIIIIRDNDFKVDIIVAFL